MIKIKSISLIIIIVIMFSCNDDSAKLKVSDFSRADSVMLKPYKILPYAMINIKFKGYVNDTIKLNWGYENPLSEIKLSGEIDSLWQTDYYGEGPRIFIFDPYIATKGKLEIDISL